MMACLVYGYVFVYVYVYMGMGQDMVVNEMESRFKTRQSQQYLL